MIRNRPDENITSSPWYLRIRGTVEQRRFSSSYRLTNLTPNTVEFIMYGRGEEELEEIREVLRVIMKDSFGGEPSVDENLYRFEIREDGNAIVIIFINITEENRSLINEILGVEDESID